MSIEIISLNVGMPKVMVYEGKELSTGIYKSPVEGTLYLSKVNLTGDGQADLRYHGGPEKAVCVYSYEHYPFWEKELDRKFPISAFGENLTVTGMTEKKVCIGDIYQWGDAVVQVTQPRQPCHKLAKRYDLPNLPLQVQETGYTGFYFRVLKEGAVTKEQGIHLLEPHPMQVSVADANRIMHFEKQNIEGIKRMLAVKELSINWRNTFTKRLEGTIEDTKNRLKGE